MPRQQETDLKIKIERVDSIDKVLKTKIAAGDPPDISTVPQPGVAASIVELGASIPLDDVVDMDALKGNMIPGTLEAGTFDDQLQALMISANVKSLIFYPKKAFEAAGYPIPQSLDELTALADQIKADGGTPWCITMESGAATGWVATDWFEDLVMRVGSVEDYEAWVKGELKFDSPVVREAAAYFEEAAFTEGNVLGGRKSIAATPFADAALPMFDEGKPGCWLLKQGSFFTGPDFMPDNVDADIDGELGVMPFPPATAGGESPVMGGGDLAMMFNDSDNAKKAMQYLSETDIGNASAEAGGFLSPHTDFDASLYPNETTRAIAAVGSGASYFLFDGSDAMPAEVGAGTFWTQMTSWINDDISLDDALTTIDESWPAS